MGVDWCSKPKQRWKRLWWRQKAQLRGSDTPGKVVLYPFFLEAQPRWAGMSKRPSQLHLAAKPSICKTTNLTGNPKSQRNLKYYDLYNSNIIHNLQAASYPDLRGLNLVNLGN